MSNVVKRFEIDPQNSSFVVETRKTGVLMFLLSLLKLSPLTSLEMHNGNLEFRESNWLGYSSVRVPAQKVTGVLCGIRRNWLYLLLCLTIIGIPVGLWLFLKNKDFFVGFENGGDRSWMITFETKNILQGREIKQESLEEIVEMIKQEMLKK